MYIDPPPYSCISFVLTDSYDVGVNIFCCPQLFQSTVGRCWTFLKYKVSFNAYRSKYDKLNRIHNMVEIVTHANVAFYITSASWFLLICSIVCPIFIVEFSPFAIEFHCFSTKKTLIWSFNIKKNCILWNPKKACPTGEFLLWPIMEVMYCLRLILTLWLWSGWWQKGRNQILSFWIYKTSACLCAC